tara:strand:+ start:105 stop:596 length:492 start_codon:yes stop_codon:yes gene_type:complete
MNRFALKCSILAAIMLAPDLLEGYLFCRCYWLGYDEARAHSHFADCRDYARDMGGFLIIITGVFLPFLWPFWIVKIALTDFIVNYWGGAFAIYWLLDGIARVAQIRVASSRVSLPTTRRVAILVASFLVWYQLVIAPANKMPIQDIMGASPPEEIADAAWWEL